MTQRIVAIDPGQTTGYVDVVADLNSGIWQVEDAQEIAWEDRFTLKPLLASGLLPLPSFVVVEQFTLYKFKAKDQVGSHFPSVRIIGTLEAYLEELGLLDKLIFQGASVRDRVQILPRDLSRLGSSVHVKDAYQHVRYFIVTALGLTKEQG